MDCTSLSTTTGEHSGLMSSTYPRRNPSVPIISARPGFIQFGEHRSQCQLGEADAGELNDGQLIELVTVWLNSMIGDLEASVAIDAFMNSLSVMEQPPPTLETQLQQVISLGYQSGALIDCKAIPAISRWTTPEDTLRVASDLTHQRILNPHLPDIDLARTIDHRSESPIHIVGSNYLARAMVRSAQIAGIPWTADPLAASIIVFPSISHPEVSDYNFIELERRPHLHVGIRHTRAVIGPLVIPGVTSCFRCLHLHRVDQDSSWPMQTISWRNSIEHSSADPLLVQMTANFSMCVIRTWLDGQPVTNSIWRTELPIPQIIASTAVEHPLCGCLMPN